MLIEALLNLLFGFLNLVLSIIHFPAAPEGLQDSLNSFLGLFDYAETLISLVIPININVYLVVLIAMFSLDHLYRPVKWIINKIIEIIP